MAKKRKKTRTVEYYRLWPGSGISCGSWDTDFIEIEIPLDTSDAEIEKAIREVAAEIDWRGGEAPVAVGLYHAGDEGDEEDVCDQWYVDIGGEGGT